jgi:proline iminopeptidase
MTVSVPGAELFYTSRGSGPTCLVLCGMGTGPAERISPPQLSDRFRLVFADLRGSGRSTGEPAELTFDVLAEDLEAIRRDLGVERVSVLGHSVLGVLAIEYGRRYPAIVSHVITAGTPPIGDMARVAASSAGFFQEDASEERKRLYQANLASLPSGPSLTQFVCAQTPMRFFDPRFDAAPLFAEAIARPALLQHVIGTLVAGWDVMVGSDSLSVPIFLAHGRYDYVVPYVLWDGIPPALPDATLFLFDRSGHQPFFEEPDRFLELLTEWMGNRI